MPTVALHTLGCKLNHAETSSIGKQFVDRGFDVVEFGGQADVCVINTCTVTARADRECRQMIRRAHRSSGNPFIIVTGCYAQLEPEEVASIEGVDLVLGAKEKFSLFDLASPLEKLSHPRIYVSDIASVDNFGPAFSGPTSGRTRAFLKVQDGCDYNCSFCTIPLARGASRSQSIEQCVSQAESLVADGFKEITLTGVNVGDYGKQSGANLLALLHSLAGIPCLERLRISSIEPNLLTGDILEFVASTPNMCNHFHIPLQSGHDEILRRMRRRYTTMDFASLIGRIRERIPACGIGVDVIVGFPGETEEHFEQTFRLLDELAISYLHVFTYSERPDTPAATFGKPVEPKIRFKRSEILRMLGSKKKQAFHRSAEGEVLPVLMEGEVENDLRYGFTENYARVAVPVGKTKENCITYVRITGSDDTCCTGTPVERLEAV